MKQNNKSLPVFCWLVLSFTLLTNFFSPQAGLAAPSQDGPENGESPINTTPAPDSAATGAPSSGVAPEMAEDTASFEIRLAWFYKPPEETSLEKVAQRFNFFIMSKGNEKERDQMLAAGARRPILEYLRFEAIHDPGSCTEQPWRNNVAFNPGDFCEISKNHPDWFLLDQNGKRIVDSYQDEDFYLMDPLNRGWQDFFIERVRQVQSDPNWGGVFLDNVEVSLSFREQDDEIPAKYPTDAQYLAATQGFLKYMYTSYFQPNGKLLFANIVARKDDTQFVSYLDYLDGAMHEGWSIDNPKRWRPASTWEQQMTLAEQAQAKGKFIILVGQGTQGDNELQRFAFASYLLVANGKAAFRYANSSAYRNAWLYDNYNIDLGAPLGPRYLSGKTWRRDFTRGSVTVNPETHEAQVTARVAPITLKHPLYLPLLKK